MALRIVQTVNVGNPCVVNTVYDCASGEAGFDGIIIEVRQWKVTTDSIGCARVDGVILGKSNSLTVKAG